MLLPGVGPRPRVGDRLIGHGVHALRSRCTAAAASTTSGAKRVPGRRVMRSIGPEMLTAATTRSPDHTGADPVFHLHVLGEGLRLQVADIDAARSRVHIRDAKGNRDRFVPLPPATLDTLRRFWQVHRNPVLLFPNRHGGLNGSKSATTPLDAGGVQTTLRLVAGDCGLKKRSRRTACATATPRT